MIEKSASTAVVAAELHMTACTCSRQFPNDSLNLEDNRAFLGFREPWELKQFTKVGWYVEKSHYLLHWRASRMEKATCLSLRLWRTRTLGEAFDPRHAPVTARPEGFK